MSNELNLSSAKTVAGENANEIINEQAGTAQVMNNKEKITMAIENNQSSMASQAGANETAIGSRVEETATVSVKESTTADTEVEAGTPVITTKLPTPEHTIPIYKYRELLKSGFKPAYLIVNRKINAAHARDLANSAKISAAKTFLTSAKVVWAVAALKAGLELSDEKDNRLTLETNGIDSYFVIIDGQHRVYATSLEPQIDLRVEFMDETGKNILRSVETMNTLSRNWRGDNYIDALKKKHSGKTPLLDEIDRLSKEFKVSRKYLLVLLCNDKDKIHLRKLKAAFSEENPDLSEYNIKQDAVEFAEKVLTAIRKHFGEGCKATSTVMFITALLNIEKCLSDMDNKDFKENLPAFIISLSTDETTEITLKLSAKNELELNQYMTSRYNTFIQSTFIEEKKSEFSQLFASTVAEKTAEDASKEEPIKKLKAGTIAQLLQNKKDLEDQKERKKNERENAAEARKQDKKECMASINQTPIEKPEL